MNFLLQQPDFGRFWLSRILSSMAFQMLSVAIGWQMYALTGSAFDLGLVGLVQFVPMVVLTLLVGHVADRFDRRRIVLLCQCVEGSVAGLLAVASLSGWLDKGLLLLLAAVVGGVRAFESPTLSALLPQLVEKSAVQQATAWSAAANQTAQIVGPSLGGVLYGFGPVTVYGGAAGALLSAGLLIGSVSRRPAAGATEPFTARSLFSGLAFVFAHPLLLGTLSLDLFAVLLGGATALLPIFAQHILSAGPWGLGLLRAAPAVGALTMSGVLARFPMRDRLGPILFSAIAVFGLATMVFAVSNNIALSLAALMTLGAADVVSVVIRMSLVQLATPDRMRGRVSAVNSLFIGTSNQLGEFESGLLASLVGAVSATLLGGAGTIVVAGLIAWRFPALWRLRRMPEGS